MRPDLQSQPPVLLRDKKDRVDGLAEVKEGGVGSVGGGWRWGGGVGESSAGRDGEEISPF